MAPDLAQTHAAGIYRSSRHNRETGADIWRSMRLEGFRAIARDRNLDLRGVRQHRPFRIAIAMIGAIVVRLSCLLRQMMIHLRIRHSLGQGLFKRVEFVSPSSVFTIRADKFPDSPCRREGCASR
jgi:hypothetical protein